MKRHAWIALTLTPAVLVIGCKSKPEPVTQVPPPSYEAEPEPLPPVSVNEGSPIVAEPGPGANDGSQYGAYEPQPQPPAQPVARTYTIRKGDTLWSIATREYGSGQKWKDIAQANPSVDPKKLAIGQQIVLP